MRTPDFTPSDSSFPIKLPSLLNHEFDSLNTESAVKLSKEGSC